MHDIGDAEHCVAQGLYRGALLLSTHPIVDAWLEETHGLESRCVSHWLSGDSVIANRERAAVIVDRLVAHYDSTISPPVCDAASLPRVPMFDAAYSYIARYHATAIRGTAFAVDRALRERGVTALECYRRPLDHFLATGDDVSVLLCELLDGVAVSRLVRDAKPTRWEPTGIGARGIARALGRRLGRLARHGLAARVRSPRRSAPVWLLFEQLYDLETLMKGVHGVDIVLMTPDGEIQARGRKASPVLPPRFEWSAPDAGDGFDDRIAARLAAHIRKDFEGNLAGWLGELQALHEFVQTRSPAVVAWGNSPILGNKALAVAYLLAVGIPVLGVQHGGIYADSVEPWHFLSDFDRCDVYASYGWSEGDLARAYPGRRPRCRVTPCGSSRAEARRYGTRPVDVLFPVTNSLATLEEGMARTAPDVLHHRQVAVAEKLEELGASGAHVVAKLFLRADERNCSILPLLGRFPNVRTADDVTLDEFLGRYTPRLVVIEYPSQPLYDVLGADCDVICIADRVLPLVPEARAELERRVHLVDSLEEALARIDDFSAGRLEHRRDDTFLRHYVTTPGAAARIVATARALAENPPSREESGRLFTE